MLFYASIYIVCIGSLIILKKKWAINISIVLLWATYAFRDLVGIDDKSYIKAFDYISRGWEYDVEISYKLFSNLANSLGMNYKFIFLLYATLSILFLYKAIKLIFSNNIDIAIYLSAFLGMVYISSVSVMRQFLSACIVFYAIIYMYKNRDFKKSILMCIVASFFHYGAFVSVPLLLIFRSDFKLTYDIKLICIIISIIIGYSKLTTKIINLVVNYLPSSYQIYEKSIEGKFSSSGGTLYWIIVLLFVSQCIISRKYPESKDVTAILERGQFVYIFLSSVFVLAGVANRLSFTYILFVATIPITFIKRFHKKDKPIFIMFLIIGMLLLLILTLYEIKKSGSGFFIPYNWSLDFFN